MKTIKLKEQDIQHIVKRVLKEEYGRDYSVKSIYDVTKHEIINDEEIMDNFNVIINSNIGAIENFELPHFTPQGLQYDEETDSVGVDGPHGILATIILPKLIDMGIIKGNMKDPEELKFLNKFSILLYNDIKPADFNSVIKETILRP